jgi:LPXTG-motif cell wall-anchored protein
VRAPSRQQSLIVTASLAGAVAGMPAAALAQSAGDEQYQDPLAGSTSTGTTKTTPSVPNPSTVPQLTPGTSTAAPSAQATTPATPSAPAASPSAAPSAASPSALPNTGIDGRVLAVLGLGMLLCGVGLRLRTARERF